MSGNRTIVWCDIDKDQIGISLKYEGEETYEVYGDLMALVFLLIRVLTITKNTDIKNDFISALGVGSGYAWQNLTTSLQGHVEQGTLDSADLNTNATGTTKEGFVLTLEFTEKSHKNRLKSRGFGLLGKNIDYASFFLLVGTYDYLLEKYQTEKMSDVINSLVKRTIEFIESAGGKVGIIEEYNSVEKLTKEAYIAI